MYSLDFREHVLGIGEKEKLSVRKLGKRFGISFNTVMNWKKRLLPTLKRNKGPSKLAHEKLIEDVKNYPDAYQHERAQRLNVSRSCVHFALKRLKITYKKKPVSPTGGPRKTVYLLPEN
jgi:transposase